MLVLLHKTLALFCFYTVVEVIHASHALYVVVLLWSILQVTWINRFFLVIYQFSEMFSGSENMHCLLKHISNSYLPVK